jgi:hypothetical protein
MERGLMALAAFFATLAVIAIVHALPTLVLVLY